EEQLPERLGAGDAAGVAAAHRDDGDRLVGAILGLAQAALGIEEAPVGLAQLGEEALQIVRELLVVRHGWAADDIARGVPRGEGGQAGRERRSGEGAWASCPGD